MAWHHIGDETTVAPVYETKVWIDKHGRPCTITTKTPTGAVVAKTHSIYRCGNCPAMAVCGEGAKPSGACQNCKGSG